jgi:polysaccharide chain length determinant protein (PEP-CTERM system associated)
MKQLTPHDYLMMALRHRWWIIIPTILCFAASVGLTFMLPKSYRSSTLILVDPQKVPEEYVRTAVTGSVEDRMSTIRQEVMSRTLLQRIIDEFHLYQNKIGKTPSEEIIEGMRKQITVDTVRGRGVDAFTISFVGDDPVSTMNVTNKLASLFIEENLKIREQLVEGTADFLTVELKQVKERLEAQERSISDYKQRYMGSLPVQMEANLRTLDRLQFRLQSINTTLREAEERNLYLSQIPPPSVGSTVPTVMTPTLRDPRIDQLLLLRRQLADLQAEYTGNYPDIAITKQKIEQLEAELRTSAPSSDNTAPTERPTAGRTPGRSTAGPTPPSPILQEIARLQEQQQTTMEQIKEYEKRVEETPKREQELANLMRDYDNTKRIYDTLSNKADNAKISENLEKRQKGEQFRIIDPANLPQQPFKPNIPMVLAMGLLVGLGVGVTIVISIEQLDTSIKKAEELEEQFGLPVLGVLPQTDALGKTGPLLMHAAAPRQPIRGGTPS